MAQSGLFLADTESKELLQLLSASVPLGSLYPSLKFSLTVLIIPLLNGDFSS